MRINKFVALATGLGRRAADAAIAAGQVNLNKKPAKPGDDVTDQDQVTFDGLVIKLPETITIMLNKPAGYVCSRQGQGSRTVYDLLPVKYHDLKPAGRLDKDSSGLLILTNDGTLAQQLTHPSHAKTKLYKIELDRPLQPLHHQLINDRGVQLEDGHSQLSLGKLDDRHWQVIMHEGRNRQIRRTFAALGYTVNQLERLAIGPYKLNDLASGKYEII